MAIAISLDAFVPAYVQHLDDLGAQIVRQNPGDADPGLTLDQRRDALLVLGEQLAPGSGHANKNSYKENVVWADIQVSGPPVP